MLKRVIITNHLGESIEYRIDGVEVENPSGLIITSIDGLGPVKASINMAELATIDGQAYNSARLSGRNIVVRALFTHASSIEEARLLTYKYFPIKKKIKFHIETDHRTAEVEGYVESNEPDIFSDQSGCAISVLCENSYFDGGKIGYTFSDTVPLFKFVFGNESLDEPHLKLSENADVSDVRNIVYDGDTDTGMEIEVGAPTDDIMDTFKITGIEITGNGEKIKIDTSKMVTQVPNTAPDAFLLTQCSFLLNGDKYKFFRKLPFSSNGNVFYHNGNIHYYDYDNHHLMLDLSKDLFSADWEQSPPTDLPSGHSYSCMVNFNETIHLYDWQTNSLIKLNEETNSWELATECPSDLNTNISVGKRAVVYNGAIHVFMTNGTSTYSLKHYKWDGTTWSQESFPNIYFGNQYSFDNSIVIAFDNKIHILGGSGSGNAAYRHDVWDGSSWSSLQNLPEASSLVQQHLRDAIVYKGRLHIFLNDHGHHHSWVSDAEGWKEEFSLGWSGFIYQNGSTSMATDGRYIFLVGWNGGVSGTYTEPQNNDHLIENDKLIINTNKGKKSISLYRDGNKYNVLNALDKGSSWLQLKRGVNKFSYSAETGADDMLITLSTNKWYEGV